jgi:uncharacterized repeat protein (TIGR04052 family)
MRVLVRARCLAFAEVSMRQRFSLSALALVTSAAIGCDNGGAGANDDDDSPRDGGIDSAVADAGASEAGRVEDGSNGPASDGSSAEGGRLDGAADDASTPNGSDASVQSVTIRFKGKVGAEELACNRSYGNLGTTRVSGTPQDFRFFVQEVRLINGKGQEVPVTFAERSPHQSRDVALIDFTDGSGSCKSGAATTNLVITGTIPADTYNGIVFVNGVSLALNNANPATAPAPLKAPGAYWGWRDGYRFVMAELLTVASPGDGGAPAPIPPLAPDAGGSDGGAPPDPPATVASFVHSGSTGCTGTPGAGISCNDANFRANRNEIRLPNFNPDTQAVVADLAAVFAQVDLVEGSQCHGSGSDCAPMFSALGINPQTGAPAATQSVFRAE